MSFSIIIPSRNLDNLKACIHALRVHGETAPIIVVWDGDGEEFAFPDALEVNRIGPCAVMLGQRPFCFARAVNVGIRAAGTDDVVILNDDALLLTDHGISCMAVHWPEFAIVSPLVRGVAHSSHKYVGIEANDLFTVDFVPFVCVLIRRAALTLCGELDEQFTPGGWEDNDYCRRVTDQGFRIGVYRGCVVDHETLPHTFRPAGKPDLYDMQTNKARFDAKWGIPDAPKSRK